LGPYRASFWIRGTNPEAYYRRSAWSVICWRTSESNSLNPRQLVACTYSLAPRTALRTQPPRLCAGSRRPSATERLLGLPSFRHGAHDRSPMGISPSREMKLRSIFILSKRFLRYPTDIGCRKASHGQPCARDRRRSRRSVGRVSSSCHGVYSFRDSNSSGAMV